MPSQDAIQFCLKSSIGGYLLVKACFSCTQITAEIVHVELSMLSSELLLVSLELQELFAIDDCPSIATASGFCSGC
jgi:hypothetical protein